MVGCYKLNRVVSGLPGALYFICCLGVSTKLESEKIVIMWPTNDLMALIRKRSRGVGAQPPLFNKQNVKIKSYVINCAR